MGMSISVYRFSMLSNNTLTEKVTAFKHNLLAVDKNIPVNQLAIFNSPPIGYRMRAEFKIWHQGQVARYAMTDPVTKKPIFIDDFPIATKAINALMPPIISAINANDILRKKCFQIEFLSTTTQETLVTMIYHKQLREEWIHAITPVKDSLNIHIIGRSRKQKIVLDKPYVNECLHVDGVSYHYQQMEGSFTQPNAIVCEKMLTWAVKNSKNFKGDLLELYCGNGNFTLPLSKNFHQVIATEISKTSVHTARENIIRNHIKNITAIRMSSEEFTQALDEKRTFKRLQNIRLKDYNFSTVFVDPPRAGLDNNTIQTIQRFVNIMYISCNPETLIKNLKVLCTTHDIKAIAAFDQFPHTHHLEVGIILSAKNTAI